MFSIRSLCLLLLSLVSFSRPLCAEPLRAEPLHAKYSRDRAARAMIAKAVDEHYLATKFDRAESVLTGTVLACEDRCAPLTVARAWMYVGIVRGSGKSDPEGAREAFDSALSLAPEVELDAELATNETRDTWQQAQQSARSTPSQERKSAAKPAATAQPAPPEREICPPGLPGCAKQGDRCDRSSDCQSGLACGPSELSPKAICQKPVVCSDQSECSSGSCEKGRCSLEPKRVETSARNNWLGLYGAVDFARLPEQSDACGGLQTASRYQCYGDQGRFDAAATGEQTPGIHAGFVRSTLRVLLAFEHAFGGEVRAGGRAGFAFLGAEGFLPVHAELRLSYAPRTLRIGRLLAPYAFAGGGVAQVDARFPLQVNTANAGDAASYQPVDAVAAFGRNFGAWGAGLRIAPSDGLELDVGLSALALFPDLGLVLQPCAGVSFGL